MTRREYCAERGVAATTLDYWQRTQRRQEPNLVKVEVEPAQPLADFALVLSNGRRIESSWRFVEAVDLRKGFEGLYGLVRDQPCHGIFRRRAFSCRSRRCPFGVSDQYSKRRVLRASS